MRVRLSVLVLTLALAGCARPTRIVSEPPGARCYVAGSFVGYTPIDLHLASAHRDIRLERDGYTTVQARLRRRFDPLSIAILPLMIIPRFSTKLEPRYLISMEPGTGSDDRGVVDGTPAITQ